jgi:hypothetical protein
MRLIIEADGEHCISVAQKDERCYLRNSQYEYSNCRVILMKIDLEKTDADEDGDNLEVEYIQGAQSWDRETHIENEHLAKGEYYVFVEMDWNANTDDTNFVVTCYGFSDSTFLRDEKSLFTKG